MLAVFLVRSCCSSLLLCLALLLLWLVVVVDGPVAGLRRAGERGCSAGMAAMAIVDVDYVLLMRMNR